MFETKKLIRLPKEEGHWIGIVGDKEGGYFAYVRCESIASKLVAELNKRFPVPEGEDTEYWYWELDDDTLKDLQDSVKNQEIEYLYCNGICIGYIFKNNKSSKELLKFDTNVVINSLHDDLIPNDLHEDC